MTKVDKFEIRKAKVQQEIEKQTRYLDHKARFKSPAERRLATWKRLGVKIGSPRDTRYFNTLTGRLVEHVPAEQGTDSTGDNSSVSATMEAQSR